MPVQQRYAASTLSNWRFRQFHLALDRGGKNQGTFLTPEATLIAAGPARLSDLGGGGLNELIVPIAVTDNVAINQNKMLQQIFEIGSRRSYFVSGHTTGTVSLSRPMFNGPSLMRLLTSATQDYAFLENSAGLATIGGDSAQVGRPLDDGQAEFYINLQAEIFDRPLGLLFYMIDQRNVPFGAMYVEDANIQAHAFNIAAQAMTIVENVSMMFDRIVPVAVTDSGEA
jgi:hypothetical protein